MAGRSRTRRKSQQGENTPLNESDGEDWIMATSGKRSRGREDEEIVKKTLSNLQAEIGRTEGTQVIPAGKRKKKSPVRSAADDIIDVQQTATTDAVVVNKVTIVQHNPAETQNRIEKRLYYESTDVGPFEVRIKPTDKTDRSQGSLARILVKLDFKHSTLTKLGRSQFIAGFKNYKDANDLARDQRLNRQGLEAFIPRYKLVRKGVIRGIPRDVDVKEIVESINKDNRDMRATDAYRITTRKPGGSKTELIDTETVCVFFRNQILPKSITLWRCRFQLKPFINRVRICFNCYKIGHMQRFCRNPSKCVNCGESRHPAGTDCHATTPVCVNCNGAHKSSDRGCPIYMQHENINRIMAYDNVSFEEARKRTIPNGNLPTTLHGRGTTDLREFPTLRPISEERKNMLNHIFGDAERNIIRARGSAETVRATINRTMEKEEISQCIKKIKEGEEGGTPPERYIETLILELTNRILDAEDKGPFLMRLFKAVDLHDQFNNKQQ